MVLEERNKRSDELRKHGIDYDLELCLDCNPQDSFVVDDIERVLAVWEGENAGDDWRWVLLLKDGRFVFLQGGCDYTGWDCQSYARHNFAESPVAAASMAFEFIKQYEVVDNLMEQLVNGKAITWREEHDKLEGLI